MTSDKRLHSTRWLGALAILVTAVALIGAAGCTQTTVAVTGTPVDGEYQGKQVFASDDEAAKALVEAAKARDNKAFDRIFGPARAEILSGDAVEDARGFESFATHAAERLRVEKQSDTASILHVGAKDWPFPIPLVKGTDGKWFFDTAAGKQEILARRVGRNELAAIKVCRAYVAAQREYASQDRDGDEVLQYATRFRSSQGKHDGLYWDAAEGQEVSPLGPMVAEASLKGYALDKRGAGRRPYQGYFFHILTKQGPAATGGKYDYVINGNMIAGFAFVACPDKYGSSGVMTFLISHQGKLYQKDLGPNTLEIVGKMTEYNPDSTWTLVKD